MKISRTKKYTPDMGEGGLSRRCLATWLAHGGAKHSWAPDFFYWEFQGCTSISQIASDLLSFSDRVKRDALDVGGPLMEMFGHLVSTWRCQTKLGGQTSFMFY